MNQKEKKEVVKDAVLAGISTFIVNGVIQYFMLRNKAPISVDSITNNTFTVLVLQLGWQLCWPL